MKDKEIYIKCLSNIIMACKKGISQIEDIIKEIENEIKLEE